MRIVGKTYEVVAEFLDYSKFLRIVGVVPSGFSATMVVDVVTVPSSSTVVSLDVPCLYSTWTLFDAV